MRKIIKWALIAAVGGVMIWAILGPATAHWKERNRVHYRDAEVTRGRIVAVVNSTGTIKPVRSVQIGSFVSGPIEELHVDFNAEVTEDQLLAKIDPRIYDAAVKRDRATLATQLANMEQTRAKLQQARNDESRSLALRAQNKGFISDAEMDQFKFNRISLEAQLAVGKALVDQAQANLDTSELNLGYCQIKVPKDKKKKGVNKKGAIVGVIIDRKVDKGQTVAATFQTPDLFTVALGMRDEMHVVASVDETDIGNVEQAQARSLAQGRSLAVRFTVDAYPDELFEGTIFQIRKNSTTIQNVVTYPVVVSAPNPHLKLLPGMTASVSFYVDQKGDVLRVPNAALRFFPQKEQVHADDRKILEGQRDITDDLGAPTGRSADDKAAARRLRNRRHVWVEDGYFLRGIEVVTGISDSRYTEVVSGQLHEGQKLVTGVQPKN